MLFCFFYFIINIHALIIIPLLFQFHSYYNLQDPYKHTGEADPVLLAALQKSFMKKLVGEKQKQYCRQGHLNEEKFLKQFHNHSQQGLTCNFESDSIYESPLGESRNAAYVLDSADGELVYHIKDDGNSSNSDNDDVELYTMAIEIKS